MPSARSSGCSGAALDRLGAVTNAALADRRPGRVRVGGLVVTRQHPMTAKGTVFLALEDETGMVNVTLWPTTWERLRGVVRRHALLLVDGELQREGAVVNLVAHAVRPLPEAAAEAGGPDGRAACGRWATPACAGSAMTTRLSRLDGPAGVGALRSSLTHLRVRSLRCSAPPSPDRPSATNAVAYCVKRGDQRRTLALLARAGRRVRPSARPDGPARGGRGSGSTGTGSGDTRPRSTAKNAPTIGDMMNAAMTTSRARTAVSAVGARSRRSR